MTRSSRWLLFGVLFTVPLVGLFAQVKKFNVGVTYREVAGGTDGCGTASVPHPLCHYHSMQTWGNDTPMKEFTYRGMNGGSDSSVNEFMNFRVLYPVGYNKTNPAKYPLIIMLHGAGEGGRLWTGSFNYAPTDVRFDNNDAQVIHGGQEHEQATGYNTGTGLPSGTVKFPGIVVWPQASYNGAWEGGWNNGVIDDNNRMASYIVEYLINNWNVDADRVSIHGLSNGAQGVWDLAAKRPDLFAAMLPMSGVATNYAAQTDILVTTPIWLFQGGVDTNPNPQASLDLINMLISKGGNPIRTVYPTTGHGTWFAAYQEPNFYPFMLAANKKNIYVFGGDPSICSGGTLKLGVSAGYVAYQWVKDGVDIAAATTRYYNVTAPGVYTVRMTRPSTVLGGSVVTTNPTTVVAKATSSFIPVLTNTGSVNIPIELGGTVNTVRLSAPLGYSTYYWYKGHVLAETTATNMRAAPISNNSGSSGDAGVYTVKVLEGTGCTSAESNAVTLYWNSPQPTTPKPSAPTFSNATQTSIKLTWNSMPAESGFEIWRQQFGSSTPSYSFKGYVLDGLVTAGSTTYVDTGIRPNGTYRYRVRAIHSSGGATFSDDSGNANTTADNTPPTPPTNLLASNITETSVTLTWSPSTDNDLVYQYDVYSGSTVVTTLTGSNEGLTAPVTTVNLPGLANYGTYNFSIRARDYTGNNSVLSDGITVTLSPQTGLNFKYYTFTGNMPGAADAQLVEPRANSSFDFTQTPAQTGTVATFDISGANTFQGVGPTGDPNLFVYAFDGYINITTAGNYRFYTASDDGSRLYINGTLLVNNDGLQGTTEVSNNSPNANDITLPVGKAAIRVTYFEQGGGNVLTVSWQRTSAPTFAKTGIPASVLFLTGTTVNNYYLVNTATPDPSVLGSWTTKSDGSSGGTAPSSFTGALQYFTIANQSSVTLTNPWAVSGTGSKVIVGNNTNAISLTLNSAFTGTMDAKKNATITVNNATMPSFGVLDPTSTVNFAVAGTIPNATYGNVNLQSASTYTLPVNTTTVMGNLVASAGVSTTGTATNLSALRIGGDLTFTNTSGVPFPSTASQQYALNFTGGKTHTVTLSNPVDVTLFSLQADFGDNIVFSNSGTRIYTFGSAQGGGLILKAGSTLNIGANNLVVNGLGAINPNTETGVIAINNGNLTLNTTSPLNSAVYFSTSAKLINNLSASTLANTNVSVLSQANIRNMVTVSGGELKSNSGSLTLLSDATGTARIAPITGGGKITGTITAQRFMEGEGRIYRYISSPVIGLSVAALQTYIPITGNFTGASTGTGLGSAPSMFWYAEPNYNAFPASGGTNADTLLRGRGYSIFVREAVATTTWQAVGTPYQGTVPFALTAGTGSASNGWNLLGNPYASPIQWTGSGTGGWTMTNISNTVYIRENMSATTYQWRVYRPGIVTGGPGQAVLANGIIAPGQAFWVQASTGPSLTISEAAKYTTNGGIFYRNGSQRNDDTPDVLNISMTNGTLTDDTYLFHEELATDDYEKLQDAVKQPNSFFNLSSKSTDGVSLAINSTPSNFCDKNVSLNIENAVTGTYSLSFYGLDKFQKPVHAELHDNFLGTTTAITEGMTYSFDITSDASSTGSNRFVINEKPIVLTASAMKTSAVCEANPSITLLSVQPDVQYQAILNGGTVSAVTAATGDTVNLSLDRTALGFGTHTISVLAGYSGCAKATLEQTINVTIDTLQTPLIHAQSGFLVATPANADHYQWLFDGEVLDGKTNSSLMFNTDAGTYQVQVTGGACSKISTPFSITGFDDPTTMIKVYPNPFKDKIVVMLPEKIEGGTAVLTNTLGQRVHSVSIAPQSSNEVTLNFGLVDQGTYILGIGKYKFKIVKTN